MKYLVTTVLAALLFLSVPVRANDQQAADLSSKLADLQSISNQIKVLDDGTGAGLAKRKENLTSTKELLDGASNNAKKRDDELLQAAQAYQAATNQQNANVSQHESAVANHNSRCVGTFSDANYVANCNAEADRLDQWMAQLHQSFLQLKDQQTSLKQQVAAQEQYESGLQERYNQLSQDTLEWAANVKKYNADRNDLLVRWNQALALIKPVAASLDNCIGRLPADADDAQIKHACGNIQFDGVRSTLQRLKDLDPATIMPGEN